MKYPCWLSLQAEQNLETVLNINIPGIFFTFVFLAIALKFLNDSLSWIVMQAILQKRVPSEKQGKIITAQLNLQILIIVLTQPFAGFAYQHLHSYWIFGMVFLLNGIILVLILKIRSSKQVIPESK